MSYLQNAKVICCGKTNYSELSFRPPLISVVYAGAFLLHNHIYSACVAAALLNALGPMFVFLAGRRFVGTGAALVASVLMAFGPFFVGVFPVGFDSDNTGNSLLTDCPALTLVALSFWLFLRALQKQRFVQFALAGVAFALAVLMRFGSIPGAGLLFLLPLLARQRGRAVLASAVGFLAAVTPYLVWSKVAYGGFLATLTLGWQNVEGPEPPWTYYLAHAPVIFTWLAVAGLAIAAAVELRLALREGLTWRELPIATPRTLRLFCWGWILLDGLFFSHMPHKEPRYVMALAAPILLLAGRGLSQACQLQNAWLRSVAEAVVAAAILWTILPSFTRLQQPFVDREIPDEVTASRFLEAQLPPGSKLAMNFNYPAFAYFTHFPIQELPIGGPEVYQAIDAMPAGEVLIAYRENESGDPRIAMLDKDILLSEVKAYGDFVIYRHR